MDWQPSLGAWVERARVHFRVWAPERKRVEVVIDKPNAPQIIPLTQGEGGTFTGETSLAQPGDLYRYRLDGGEAYPDPASRYQPQGVHGPSEIIDPGRFHWTDTAWKGISREELILYEAHVGTFTPEGTFDGMRKRLPDLVQLGINALEIMPLADFPGRWNWGYDGVAPFAPARCYGRPDDLRRLIDQAHRLGLAVFIDVVYNHLGPDGNYTGVYSPHYVTSRHQTAWGHALNFDGEQNSGTREFFIQNALHWIQEYHADGLRLDATHAIMDESHQPFLAELTSRIHEATKEERKVHVIAEDNRNLVSLLRSPAEGGSGLSAVWSDDFHHQVRRITAGDHEGYYLDFSDRLSELVETLRGGWYYRGQYAPFFGGPRGSDPAGIALNRFVFFIQNHDQIGNRATGERLHHQISAELYRAVSALLLSLPEIPLLFMGQEWAASTPFLYYTDHAPELGRAVSEGRKEEFKAFTTFSGSDIPDPQSAQTFERSKLNWSEKLKEPHESVWLFYVALLKWRREELQPWKEATDFQVEAIEPSTLVLKRFNRSGKAIWIILQMKNGAHTVDLSALTHLEKPIDRTWDVVHTSEEKAFAPDPEPPVIRLSAAAPVIEFSRPGAVILKERGRSV